jgi:hypothetical protein
LFGLSDEITEAEIIWAGKVPTINKSISFSGQFPNILMKQGGTFFVVVVIISVGSNAVAAFTGNNHACLTQTHKKKSKSALLSSQSKFIVAKSQTTSSANSSQLGISTFRPKRPISKYFDEAGRHLFCCCCNNQCWFKCSGSFYRKQPCMPNTNT